MKKTFIFFIILVIGILILYFLKPMPFSVITGTEKNQLPETNMAIATSDTNSFVSPPITAVKTNESFNALTATNLEQWKMAIKDLVRLGGIPINQDWIFEQHKPDSRASDRNSGIPITLSQNGKTVTFTATFVNLATKNGSDDDLRESELYSLNMNIDETRTLGLQLCDMLQVDSKGFADWCDKVGNHWIDAPLYANGKGIYGFQILRSYDDDKPWYINFVIRNP